MDSFNNTLKLILNSVDYIQKVNNDKEMSNAFIDSYVTKQQMLRDKKVTELLESYVDEYKYKNKSNRWYKGILVGFSLSILLAFSVVFIILICRLNSFSVKGSSAQLAEIISVCVTFLALIVGILNIIAKYVFPENEEEYITRIVEIIQKNDLENKKENIKTQVKQEMVKDTDTDDDFEKSSN